MKEVNKKKKKAILQISNSLKTNSDRTINSITPLNNEKSISVNSKTNSINPIKSKFNREIKNDSIFELGKINLLNNNSTTQKIDSSSSFLQSFSDEEKYYIDELTSNLRVPKKLKNLLDLSSLAKKQFSKYIIKIKILDISLCLISIVTIILSFLDNYQIVETYNPLTKKYIVSQFNNILRFFTLAFNIILVTLIIIRYNLLLKIHKISLGSIAEYDTIHSIGLLPYLIFEIIINLLFTPPFIDSSYTIEGSLLVDYNYTYIINPLNLNISNNPNINTSNIISTNSNITDSKISNIIGRQKNIQLTYNISSIISFLMMFRIYHVFRFFLSFSYWQTPRASTVCNWMNTRSTKSFALKAYLKNYPYITLIISIFFLMIVSGLSTQLFEYYNGVLMRSLGKEDYNTNHTFVNVMLNFSNVYNSLWLMLMTMTTVGFGEIYPTTYFGRIIAIFACIFGNFIMSLLVVFLNITINFDDVEKIVYNEIIEHKSNNSNLKKDASIFIGKFLRYCYLSKKFLKETSCQRLFLLTEMKFLAKNFKKERIKSIKLDSDTDSILNNINNNVNMRINPLKMEFEHFIKHKFGNKQEDSFEILNKSNEITQKMLKNCIQIWNLMKVLNKPIYLKNLFSIDEIYDLNATFIEEIEYFHNNKKKYDFEKEEDIKENEGISSNLSNPSIIESDEDLEL